MKSARITASAVSIAALATGTLVLTAPPAAAATTNSANYNCSGSTLITSRFDFTRYTSGKFEVRGDRAPLNIGAGQVHINWGSYSLTNPTSLNAGDAFDGGPAAGVATMTAPPATLTIAVDPSPTVPMFTITCAYVPGTASPALPWAL